MSNSRVWILSPTLILCFALQALAQGPFVLSSDQQAIRKFPPDGERFLVSNFGRNGGIEVYDSTTGDHLGAFADDSQIRSDGIHIMPDGSVLIAYHFANTVNRYDHDGTPLGVFADANESLALPNGILHVVPAPASLGVALATHVPLARRRRR